jgi:stage IV sporulation protein B
MKNVDPDDFRGKPQDHDNKKDHGRINQDHKFAQWLGFLLVLLLMLGSTTSVFQQWIQFPHEIRLFQGESKQLPLSMPATATASVSDPRILHVNGFRQAEVPVDLKKPVTLFTNAAGKTWLTLNLFGAFPIKKVQVNVYPRLKVIPGGQSIGVKVYSKGVIVVGHHRIQTSDEKVDSPAEKADIRIGDYIVAMNGKPVNFFSSSTTAKGKALNRTIKTSPGIRRRKVPVTTPKV